MMARTFKVLSLLLAYPTPDIQAAAGDMREVLRDEGLLNGRSLSAVLALIDEIGERDIYDLQERYTLLFDRTRSLSLHLFEHVHGESRDRGQAMVDLAHHYEGHGFSPKGRELPDYLPMFLEFLSLLPVDEARALLAEALHITDALEARLRSRKSVYASVFRALRTLSRGRTDPDRRDEIRRDPGADPADLAALDAEWEEAAVTFGSAGLDDVCGRTRLVTRLRAHARPPAKPCGT